jgi:hypothetical protein
MGGTKQSSANLLSSVCWHGVCVHVQAQERVSKNVGGLNFNQVTHCVKKRNMMSSVEVRGRAQSLGLLWPCGQGVWLAIILTFLRAFMVAPS